MPVPGSLTAGLLGVGAFIAHAAFIALAAHARIARGFVSGFVSARHGGPTGFAVGRVDARLYDGQGCDALVRNVSP
jgi:hypothetical protein